VEALHPWEAILDHAKSQQCDLIVMASHGRRGVAALLLGSETSRVLIHSEIPVLVVK
jgi:nucleotide-binding universal stress UspA family protein